MILLRPISALGILPLTSIIPNLHLLHYFRKRSDLATDKENIECGSLLKMNKKMTWKYFRQYLTHCVRENKWFERVIKILENKYKREDKNLQVRHKI